jgi:hypothetical protein
MLQKAHEYCVSPIERQPFRAQQTASPHSGHSPLAEKFVTALKTLCHPAAHPPAVWGVRANWCAVQVAVAAVHLDRLAVLHTAWKRTDHRWA